MKTKRKYGVGKSVNTKDKKSVTKVTSSLGIGGKIKLLDSFPPIKENTNNSVREDYENKFI